MSYWRSLLSELLPSLSSNRRFRGQAGWLSDFTGWLTGIIDAFWTQCANALQAFMEWVADLVGPILEWFGETLSALAEAISSYLSPIIDFLGEQYADLVAWVSGAIETVVGWYNDIVIGGLEWLGETTWAFGRWTGTTTAGGVAWLRDTFKALDTAFIAMCKDMLVSWVETCLKLWVKIVTEIPVPDFIQDYSIGHFLGQAGPTIGWLVNTLHIPQAMMIVAAAYAFRIKRKMLTGGQW